MASKNSRLARLASYVDTSGSYTQAAGIAVYNTTSQLPLVGNEAGDMAFVDSSDKLYIYSGEGWYNIGLVNQNPTITSGGDASYDFEMDGTPIVITLVASDPEGIPLTWSYAVTSGTLGNTATVSQTDNVFTITPSTDNNNAGEFSITFTASDGVNIATSISAFTLAFGAADQYYSYNSLLIKSGSTAGLNNHTFIDESTNGLTVTRNGDVYQGSFSPYPPAYRSVYFDGDGDGITISGAETVSGTFTVEFWLNTTKPNTHIFTKYPNGGSTIDMFAINTSGNVISGWPSGTPDITSTTNVCDGQWHHVAFCRDGTTYRLFVDGVLESTVTNSENGAFGTGEPWVIGRHGRWTGSTYQYQGYLRDLRFVLGTAVYTSNFTPPTEPLTAITGTEVLACQDSIFAEYSPNNYSAVPSGNTKLVNFSPYTPPDPYYPTANAGSAYFDGSGDWIDTSTSSALTFGTNDFTIEFWAYFTSISASTPNLIDMRGASHPSVRPTIYLNNGTLTYYSNGANRMTGGVLTANRWYHIACTKNGNNTRFFVNGVQTGIFTDTSNYTCNKVRIFADDTGGGTAQAGYCSDVRIINGTALYTSDFTPPTEPLTAVSGTALLLKMGNAGIYDEMARGDIKLVGDVTTSTTQTKYNDTSMYFDGTGDYLTMPASDDLNISSLNFTIEAWVYPTTKTNTVDSVFGYGLYRTMLYHNGSNWSWEVGSGSSNYFTLTAGYSGANWQHIALVRDGNTYRFFKDGILVDSATNSNGPATSGVPLYIGWNGNSSQTFTGYLSDVRITKGVARYTGNFTPPTAALGFSNAE